MGLFDNIEKLINEHGSATILRERIIQAQEQYAALEKRAAEADASVIRLELQLRESRAENDFLNKKLQDFQKDNNSPQLKFASPFCYAEGDQSPYCPKCWEVDRRAIHLLPPEPSFHGPRYSCPHCNMTITHPYSKPQSSPNQPYVY
jgi:hypothetical protein